MGWYPENEPGSVNGKLLHPAWSRSPVVILGSSGFIGAALLAALQQRGCPSVRGFRSATLNLVAPEGADRLAREVDEETILIVTARARRGPDPHQTLQDDVTLACNVARCLARCKVKHCVYFSSTAVYGDGGSNLAISEDTPLAPTSHYGAAKVTCEWVIRQAGEAAGVPVTVLRPCLVYGPGDTSPPYGPGRFIEAIRRGEPVRLFGDGTELRDNLFIQDLVEITLRLALEGQRGTFNVATGCSHSFQALIGCLRQAAGGDFVVISRERDRPRTDQKIDVSRLLRTLPGLRFTSLEAGLAETYHAWTPAQTR